MSWLRRGLFAAALIIAFVIAAEIWSSWRSERSGPFAYFYDPARPGNRPVQAEAGIRAYLSQPRSSSEATGFLQQAGFLCHAPDRDSLANEAMRLQTTLSDGIACTYRSGRYFIFLNIFVVVVVFDIAGRSTDHEIFIES